MWIQIWPLIASYAPNHSDQLASDPMWPKVLPQDFIYSDWEMQALSFLWGQKLVKCKPGHIWRSHLLFPCSKKEQPAKWSGVRVWDRTWVFFVIAAKPAYSTKISSIFPKALYGATYQDLRFPPFGKLGEWIKGILRHGMCRNLKQGSVCICLVVDILVPNEVIWTSVAYLPRAS